MKNLAKKSKKELRKEVKRLNAQCFQLSEDYNRAKAESEHFKSMTDATQVDLKHALEGWNEEQQKKIAATSKIKQLELKILELQDNVIEYLRERHELEKRVKELQNEQPTHRTNENLNSAQVA